MTKIVDMIKIGDIEYKSDELSDKANKTLSSLNFVNDKLSELQNLNAIMQRARNSYIESLKREILSKKAGIHLEE